MPPMNACTHHVYLPFQKPISLAFQYFGLKQHVLALDNNLVSSGGKTRPPSLFCQIQYPRHAMRLPRSPAPVPFPSPPFVSGVKEKAERALFSSAWCLDGAFHGTRRLVGTSGRARRSQGRASGVSDRRTGAPALRGGSRERAKRAARPQGGLDQYGDVDVPTVSGEAQVEVFFLDKFVGEVFFGCN